MPARRWPKFSLLILILTLTTLSTHGAENEPGTTPALSDLSLTTSLFSAASQSTAGGLYISHGTLGESFVGSVGGPAAWNLHSGFWAICAHLVFNVVSALPQPIENYLIQNFPNPFNPSTTIRYAVASESPVSLAVFSLKGELVCNLVSERQPPGVYEVLWEGRNSRGSEVASGLYFCRLRIGDFNSVNKMMLLK